MILLIGAIIVSLLPSLCLFYWLRNVLLKDHPDFEGHKQRCTTALFNGLLCTLLSIVAGFTLYVAGSMLNISSYGTIPWKLYSNFIVTVAVDVVTKYCMFVRTLKKYPDHEYSWIELIIYMIGVGTTLTIVETVGYAVGSSPAFLLVRGMTMMHVGFAFIMGYYYGKGHKTGKRLYFVLAFLLPWLMYGLYDFCLDDAVLGIFEHLGFVSLAIAVMSFALAIYMVVFFRKAREDENFMTPFFKVSLDAE